MCGGTRKDCKRGSRLHNNHDKKMALLLFFANHAADSFCMSNLALAKRHSHVVHVIKRPASRSLWSNGSKTPIHSRMKKSISWNVESILNVCHFVLRELKLNFSNLSWLLVHPLIKKSLDFGQTFWQANSQKCTIINCDQISKGFSLKM